MRLPALALFAVVVAAPAVPAQRDRWLVRAQHEDGYWPTADFGAEPDAELRVTGLLLLAFVGDGSCIRSGPYKDQVKLANRWLRQQQDADGRFRLRADPHWLLDHAIATLALAEDQRFASYPTLVAPVTRAAKALAGGLAKTRPAADAELRLWSEVVVRSLRTSARSWAERPREDLVLPLRAAADELTAALAALPASVPATPRQRVAARLLAELQGDQQDDAAAAPLQLPENLLADPLLAFYTVTLAYRLGGEGWKTLQRQLVPVVKSQIAPPAEFAGSWDPVGPFGEQNGRLGTTAAAVLLLEIHYRYCRLAFID